MNSPQQLAKHIRDFHFGGNWTVSCLKDLTEDVNWKQATQKIEDLNTIAALVYHINYFVRAVIPVLEGGKLDAHDKFSYDHPPINSKEEWDDFLEKVWADAKTFARLVEHLPEDRLYLNFEQEKYGSYFRNILGIIEHSHYHLGQIAIIKKLLN